MSDRAWRQNSDALAAFGSAPAAKPRRPPPQQQPQRSRARAAAAAPDAFSTLVADAFATTRPAPPRPASVRSAPAAGANANPFRAGSSARTADPFASSNGAARPADPFADADSLYEALPAAPPPARPAAQLPANPFAPPPMRAAAPTRARAAPMSTGYPPPVLAPPAMLAPTSMMASPIVAPPAIVAPPTLATTLASPPSPIARRPPPAPRRPGNPFAGLGADADPRLGAPPRSNDPFAPGAGASHGAPALPNDPFADVGLGAPPRPNDPFAPGADATPGAPPDNPFAGLGADARAAPPSNPFAPGGLADAWTAADADLNFGLLLGAGAPGDASETNNGDDAAKRRERAHSLKELLATERVYRDQLACVVERLQRPLAWACAGGPAPADAADTRALPGAEVARALHAALDPLPAAALLAISDALIAQLAARTADGGTERVGEVFEAAAPKVLEAMCSWYDWHERAASELRRLTEASAGARAFVRRAEADERCGDGRAARRGTPTVRLHLDSGLPRRRGDAADRADAAARAAAPLPEAAARRDGRAARRRGRARARREALARDARRLRRRRRRVPARKHHVRSVSHRSAFRAGAHAARRRAEALARLLDGAPPGCAVAAAGRRLAHEGELAKVGNATVRPDYFALFETSAGAELLHASAPDARGRLAFRRFLRVLHVEDVEVLDGGGDAALGGIDAKKLVFAKRRSLTAAQGDQALDRALLLRVVCADPRDWSRGHVYSLGGDRAALVEWKAKLAGALGRRGAEWKLRFKGPATCLGEAPGARADGGAADGARRDAFLWFFSGPRGALLVRATAGRRRSGKLEWRDAWRVDGVAAADDGDTFRVAARAPGDGRPWTLLFASDDRDVIVALMKK